MKKKVSVTLAILTGLLLNISSVQAAGPLSQTLKLKNVNSASRIVLPELNLASLRSKAFGGSPEKVLEFAKVTEHNINAKTASKWMNIAHQGQTMSVWRLAIESQNAYSINLGFSNYSMPKNGKLFIYAEGYQNMVGPFTEADNEDHGQLWSPIIPGKRIIVEINVPTESVKDVILALDKINQAYLDVTKLSEEFRSLKSGSCNFDVVCPQGDAWRDQIQSVAAYSLGGSLFCTGAAINNTANDERPFFLTANHCGIDSTNAPSVVAYWNFQNSTCRAANSGASGSSGNGVLTQFNTGAIFRASYPDSDMTLLEFDDRVLRSANVFFSGWNRADSTFSSAVAIHHPNVDEKRISFENDPITISSYLGSTGSGSKYIRVADWDLGTTEPGSSGSPLYDPQKRIIGQLHGGFAACGNNDADWYGRINQSWIGGGTNASSLKNWLDPSNSGLIAIDGVFASVPAGTSATLPSIYLVLDED